MRINRVIGLDIGSSAIKAAQVRIEGDRYVVERTSSRPLSPNMVKEGLIAEGAEKKFAAELADFVKQAGFKTNRVIIGINNSRSAFVREALVPWARPEDLRAALPNFVQSQPSLAGISPEDAEIDFTEVAEVGEGRTRKLRVLVYAARREAVETITLLAKQAGLYVVGADLNSLAALRVLRIAHREGNVIDVLVDVGAQVTSIIIHQNGVPRAITLSDGYGGSTATEEVANQLGIENYADAERAKLSGTVDDQVGDIIASYNRKLVNHIASTVEGFLRMDKTVQPQAASVTLLGGGALILGLDKRLEERLGGVPVVWGDYAANFAPESGSDGMLDRLTPEGSDIAIAVGLATGAQL